MFWPDFRSPFWVHVGFSTFFFLGRAFPPSSVLPEAVIMDGRVPHCTLQHFFGEGGVGTAVVENE